MVAVEGVLVRPPTSSFCGIPAIGCAAEGVCVEVIDGVEKISLTEDATGCCVLNGRVVDTDGFIVGEGVEGVAWMSLSGVG